MDKKQTEEDRQWNEYKKSLDSIPSYLILQQASKIVFDYVDTKRPIVISWFDKTDDCYLVARIRTSQ